MPDLLKKDLENQKALVLDGAMATELEKRGVNTDSQLWSAAALINHPQAVKMFTARILKLVPTWRLPIRIKRTSIHSSKSASHLIRPAKW